MSAIVIIWNVWILIGAMISLSAMEFMEPAPPFSKCLQGVFMGIFALNKKYWRKP